MKLVTIHDTYSRWFLIVITLSINFLIKSANTNYTSSDKSSYSIASNKTGEPQKPATDNLNKTGPVTPTQQSASSSIPKPIVTLVSPSDTNINFKAGTTNLCKCGVASSASGKIVGGTPVKEDNFWPWFAALVRADRSAKVHCGASLISRRYLLSAAHCLVPMTQVGLRNFRVRLGYHELHEEQKNDNGTSSSKNQHYDELEIPIESVTVHPQYEQSFPYHYDIGIVKLSYAINCTNRIRPICLPSADHPNDMHANETAIATGFGRTAIDGNHSKVLYQVRLKLISIDECRKSFAKSPLKVPDVLENMHKCTWSKGKDTCVGDSGGPLFLWRQVHNWTILGESETSNFEQVGVTSWGIGCANENYPSVYSKVFEFLPWIQSVVK